MNRFVAVAVAGIAFAVAAASAQNVEDRQSNLQRRIAEDIERGRVTPHDASHLEHDMDKVSRHIAEQRREHHGRLSPHEWERLNHEMDKVEQRLHEAERYAHYDDRHDRRYEQDGFYGSDHRSW